MKYLLNTEPNVVVRNIIMGNPQEMTAFISDWLEQLIHLMYLTITKIFQHKYVFPGVKCKQRNLCLTDQYVFWWWGGDDSLFVHQ